MVFSGRFVISLKSGILVPSFIAIAPRRAASFSFTPSVTPSIASSIAPSIAPSIALSRAPPIAPPNSSRASELTDIIVLKANLQNLQLHWEVDYRKTNLYTLEDVLLLIYF